ncbi:MAG: glycosyltransferase family 39 protein [Bacteroidales bacterium]
MNKLVHPRKLCVSADKYTIGLLVLTLIAFLMRIYNVDFLTLWVDEYVHVDRARFFPESPLLTNDNNGILLTLFVIPLFKLFGVNEFWARFPSVVFGTLLVPLAYLFVKKYLNSRNTALITATLVTFSTYLTFWSRICRNYAVFAFFFLLFLYFLGQAINVDESFKETKSRVLNYLKLQPRYFLVALILLVFSILSHQLTFLVVYGVMFYYVLLFIDGLLHKKFRFGSMEAVISYLFLLFSIIVFVPSVQEVFKAFFLLFLPQNVANWVLPNMERLGELMDKEPYSALNIYNNVLKNDYALLYLPGIAGFICCIARYRKQGVFLASLFAVLFFAMSFVFREPSLPRYLIYIYPLFLVAIACFFDSLALIARKAGIKNSPVFAVVVSIIIIVCLPTARTTLNTVLSKEHGQVVPSYFSAFYFPDWKTSMQKVKKRLGEKDILLSTMPSYVDFYSGKKSYWFRQRRYNSTEHKYENFPVDTVAPNAFSTPALAKLLNGSERAWLLADYYFDNVMTDPETRAYVVRNMQFELGMSDDYVSVFSWDRNHARVNNNAIFEYLRPAHPYSREYRIDVPAVANATVLLDMEGVAYDYQAILYINKQPVGVLKQHGHSQDNNDRQIYSVPVSSKMFRQGDNSFVVALNPQVKNKNNRFVVYNIRCRY